MPLARYSLFQRGLEMSVRLRVVRTELMNRSYLAPTADARPTWLPTMQHIAQEGRCLVISGQSPLCR